MVKGHECLWLAGLTMTTGKSDDGGTWGATDVAYPGWMRVTLRTLGVVAVALALFLTYAAFVTDLGAAAVLLAVLIVAAACLTTGIAALLAPGRPAANPDHRNM
jgi:hypothetical protein